MSNFNGQGYFTLSDLDSFDKRLAQIEASLGIVTSTDSRDSDLVFYRNAKADQSAKSTVLNIVNAGFEVLRLQMNVKQTTMKVTFGQDFIEPPVVLAGADAYSSDYAAFVDNVTTSGCTIRLVKIKDKLGKAQGKTEYINIIAAGKTKD